MLSTVEGHDGMQESGIEEYESEERTRGSILMWTSRTRTRGSFENSRERQRGKTREILTARERLHRGRYFDFKYNL